MTQIKDIDELKRQGKISDIIYCLRNEADDVRNAAVFALVQIGPSIIAPLLEYPPESNKSVQAASQVLWQFGEPAFEVLISALKDDSWDTRIFAARALRPFHDVRAVEPLFALYKDKSLRTDKHKGGTGTFFSMVAITLGRMGAPAVESLISALHDDGDIPESRSFAAYGLGETRDVRALEPLITALDNDEEDYLAVQALGNLGYPQAIKPLIEYKNRIKDQLNIDIVNETLEKLYAKGMVVDKTIICTGDTLVEALEQLKLKVPADHYLISKEILFNGDPATIEASADTIENAFGIAERKVPTDAKILSKKRLSLPGDKIAVTVEAYNEEEAVAKFHGQVKNAVSITSSKLIAKGRKSFLGSKAIPNKYEMEALQQDAVVSLTYKPKITVSADFEVKCSVCKRSNSQYLQDLERRDPKIHIISERFIGICPTCQRAYCVEHAAFDGTIDHEVCPEHRNKLEIVRSQNVLNPFRVGHPVI